MVEYVLFRISIFVTFGYNPGSGIGFEELGTTFSLARELIPLPVCSTRRPGTAFALGGNQLSSHTSGLDWDMQLSVVVISSSSHMGLEHTLHSRGSVTKNFAWA